jgi:hypothetical protein
MGPIYVLDMADDLDIKGTRLHPGWEGEIPVMQRYTWRQVTGGNLNIPDAAVIVVIAHGSDTEIGSAHPVIPGITPAEFLVYIQNNMFHNKEPGAVYISTCGHGIAEYAASVKLAADANGIWRGTPVYGHRDPVSGTVPPPKDIRWTPIL